MCLESLLSKNKVSNEWMNDIEQVDAVEGMDCEKVISKSGASSRLPTRSLILTTKHHNPARGWFRRSPILERQQGHHVNVERPKQETTWSH